MSSRSSFLTFMIVACCITCAEFAQAGGLWSRGDCEQCDQAEVACKECSRPKRHCCLFAPEAPRGEVAFALPGVVRDGQAFRVSEESFSRAIRQAAAESAKAPESAVMDSTIDGRLTKLENDVKKMQDLMDRMAIAVERLAEQKASAAAK